MSDDDNQIWGAPVLSTPVAIKPNAADIRAHINWLIEPLLVADKETGEVRIRAMFEGALFEIAYGIDGPRNAKLFLTHEVEEAVQFVLEVNKTNNVYIGATFKKPGTPRNKRTSGKDFFVATAVPADVDTDYQIVKARMSDLIGESPLTIITGKVPDFRSHHWFRLTQICDDADEFEDAFEALVEGIGADGNVKDAARVMRLGGTVSYPDNRKMARGYVKELTRTIIEPRGVALDIERLISLPPVEAKTTYRAGEATGKNNDGGIERDGFGLIIDGREQFFRDLHYAMVIKFQHEHKRDPEFDDIFEPAYEIFCKRVKNPHDWTRAELAKRVRNTIRRLKEDRMPNKSIAGGKWQPSQGKKFMEWGEKFNAQIVGDAKADTDYKIPQIKTIHQLIEEYTPPHYIVDRMIRKAFLYTPTGRSGHLKTMAFLRIGVDVALGNPIGQFETAQCNVAFLAGENYEIVRNRLLVLCEAEGYDTSNMPFYIYEDTFKLDVGYQQVVRDAEKIGGFGLVIVDTFSAYCRLSGIEENDNQAMGLWTKDVLRNLTKLPGDPAVLAISHPAGHVQTKAELRPRGATSTMGEVDGIITVWREGNLVELEAHPEKFRGAPFYLKMQMKVGRSDKLKDTRGRPLEEIYGKVISEEEAARVEDEAERLDLSILQSMEDFHHQNDEWPSARQLSARMSVPHHKISERQLAMSKTKGLKHVAKTRNTKTAPYKLTDAGKEYLRDVSKEKANSFPIAT